MRDLFLKGREGIRYLICGGLTTIVNFVSFCFLAQIAGVSIVKATAVAWLSAVVFAYLVNKIYVFKSENTHWTKIIQEAGSFFGARVLSGIFEIFGMVLMVDCLSCGEMWSKIFLSFLVMVFNFFVSKFYIF